MSHKRKNTRAVGTLAFVLIVIIVAVVAFAVGVAAVLLKFWPFLPEPGEVVGSGSLVTEDMEFSDFTIVDVGWAFEVDITRSDSYTVSITADDNVMDYVQVDKAGDKLTIGLKPRISYRSVTLRAKITMPELYELSLSGASRGTVQGFSISEKFALELSGASSLTMVDMSVGDAEIAVSGASVVNGGVTSSGDVEFTLSGASTALLRGEANDLLIDASGASHLGLSDFPVHNVDVELSGASHATINLDGRLNADLSGASNLLYIGNPILGDIETSGGSLVRRA